jgi:hypothetical protein
MTPMNFGNGPFLEFQIDRNTFDENFNFNRETLENHIVEGAVSTEPYDGSSDSSFGDVPKLGHKESDVVVDQYVSYPDFKLGVELEGVVPDVESLGHGREDQGAVLEFESLGHGREDRGAVLESESCGFSREDWGMVSPYTPGTPGCSREDCGVPVDVYSYNPENNRDDCMGYDTDTCTTDTEGLGDRDIELSETPSEGLEINIRDILGCSRDDSSSAVQEVSQQCCSSIEETLRKINQCPGIYMSGSVQGVDVDWTTDTGATKSIISRSFYERIPQNLRPELSKSSCLTSVSGEAYIMESRFQNSVGVGGSRTEVVIGGENEHLLDSILFVFVNFDSEIVFRCIIILILHNYIIIISMMYIC